MSLKNSMPLPLLNILMHHYCYPLFYFMTDFLLFTLIFSFVVLYSKSLCLSLPSSVTIYLHLP